VTKAEGYRKVLESMGRKGRPVDFSKITCPVLIIVGAYDLWSGPEAGKILQQRIPGSELVILPTGHACQIERSGEFNETSLSFLHKARKSMPLQRQNEPGPRLQNIHRLS
jgi:pimeloyl-ACP methyl ester carboxylesterase